MPPLATKSQRAAGFRAATAASVPFPFRLEERVTPGGIRLSYYDVVDFPGFAEYLDSKLVRICFGPGSNRPLEVAKAKLRKLFESKVGTETWVCGSCAELFLHLYLSEAGYEQAFLYFNLEERSIKKGFDGVYLRDGEIWLMESKSSVDGKVSHLTKVMEAFRGLKADITGEDPNDPWQNAVNHALCARVDGSVVSVLEELSDRFMDGEPEDITSFNLIPCGTLFMGETLSGSQLDSLGTRLDEYFGEREHGPLHVVCVSHFAKNVFLEYIGLEAADE